MTNRSVLLPQGVPTATATQAPSKFPPPSPAPPPLFRAARRGSSASGLFFRAGFSLSTARGVWREPDSDFSSLPMLPPALPDCASERPVPNPTNSTSDTRPVLIERRMAFCISVAFKFLKEKMLAARAVGTDRANHPARFAILAALVKRGLFGALNVFALNKRPGFGRDREGAASVAKEAQFHRAFARA